MKACSAAGAVAALAPLCHGAPSCRLTADPAQLGLPECQDIHVSLKIAFACVQRNNFLPQFIRKQESTILEPKPGPDLGSELSLGSDKSNHSPHSAPDPSIHPTGSSPPSQVARPAASEAEADVNWFYKLCLSIWLNVRIMKDSPWKLMLVCTLSLGLGVSCFLVLLTVQLCRLYRKRTATPLNTSTHIDLDSDLLDYEINAQLYTPLPEPKIMQVQEAEPSKFSTLTRARGRGGAPSSLPPLTDMLADPALSTAVRYSTIGRNRTQAAAALRRDPLDTDLAEPKTLNTSYENNHLYY